MALTIVATDGDRRWLLRSRPGFGRVLDREAMLLHTEAPLNSLVARGPWARAAHDREKLAELLAGVREGDERPDEPE